MDIATPVDRHRIFDDPWCPLYGKIPDVLKGSGDRLTDQCVKVIEESRKIWTSASVAEDKLKIAKELWDLFRIHHNLVSNGHTRIKSITTESICETIIAETKKLSLSGLDGITHAEILGIYTIHVVFSALKYLWEPLDRIEIDDVLYCLYSSPLLDEDSFVNAKIYIARLLLSQAKKMANYTQEETKKDKITQPEYKSEKQTENNVFRWRGGTWEITFDGVTIRPPDSFGLRYIHYLLEKHGKGIPSSKLRKIVADKGNETLLRKRGEEVTAEDVFQAGKSDVKIDKQAEKAYKLRLGELENEIKCAEEKGCELELSELEKEKEALMKELKSSTNKFGHSRKLGEKADTDRIAVKQNIETALNTILMGNKSLSKHLKEHIKTGFTCFYTSGFNWILK